MANRSLGAVELPGGAMAELISELTDEQWQVPGK